MKETSSRYDVVIIGAGLAGLTLARQLLLKTEQSILLIDKRADPLAQGQKVGESLVQLSGYYLSKVLELEEHLLTSHFLKYNLRFHWKTAGSSNRSLEDYSVSFIRLGSNIPTFQVDRNLLERHLLELNSSNPRFQFEGGAANATVQLAARGTLDDHVVAFDGGSVRCRWVVDASGRAGVLKRQLALAEENSIRHGSTWCWVDGLVNIEKLTGRSSDAVRLDPDRRKTGHMPFFLATNHFCDEGMWFWVIPLHGKTSLGLVYDRAVLEPAAVSNSKKLIDFVCRKWPLFDGDLQKRAVLDEGRFFDYSYGARQTISAARWALTGESGRFSDPLYSPGTDLITIHNTLITSAVQLAPDDLERVAPSYEQIMQVMYESYVPSYSVSYNCLGDQEVFSLKYAWELAVYFGFFVVPGINDLFTNPRAMSVHMRKYGLLGPINRSLQKFLSDYARWKKTQGAVSHERTVLDFYRMCPLRESEKLFYEVALSADDADAVFSLQFERLREFARYLVAQVYACVLQDLRVLENGAFISSLKLRTISFDAARMREEYRPFAACPVRYEWTLNPHAMAEFVQKHAPVEAQEEVAA